MNSWNSSMSSCNFTYYMVSIPTVSSSAVTFDTTELVFTVQSTSNSDIGTYEIYIFGYVATFTTNAVFTSFSLQIEVCTVTSLSSS